MKAAPKTVIRRTPTPEDIKIWEKNPRDPKLPVPPTAVHGHMPGYRKSGGPIDGVPTGTGIEFFKRFNEVYGESWYSHFDDGEKVPQAQTGMSAADATNLIETYKRKEMPAAFGETSGQGFFKKIWHKLPERAKAAARLLLGV